MSHCFRAAIGRHRAHPRRRILRTGPMARPRRPQSDRAAWTSEATPRSQWPSCAPRSSPYTRAILRGPPRPARKGERGAVRDRSGRARPPASLDTPFQRDGTNITEGGAERSRTHAGASQTCPVPANARHGPQPPSQLAPSGEPQEREQLLARPSTISDAHPISTTPELTRVRAAGRHRTRRPRLPRGAQARCAPSTARGRPRGRGGTRAPTWRAPAPPRSREWGHHQSRQTTKGVLARERPSYPR